MKSIVISVQDKDYDRLRETLEKLDFIELIDDHQIDPYSLVSQKSLADEWLREEDNRYDLKESE